MCEVGAWPQIFDIYSNMDEEGWKESETECAQRRSEIERKQTNYTFNVYILFIRHALAWVDAVSDLVTGYTSFETAAIGSVLLWT